MTEVTGANLTDTGNADKAWALHERSVRPGRQVLWRWFSRRQLGAALLVSLPVASVGCNSLLKNNELPPEVTDPAITRTPQGALAAYHGTVAWFGAAYGGSASELGTSSSDVTAAHTSKAASFVGNTGLLSDELHLTSQGALSVEDARILPESNRDAGQYPNTYSLLQRVRGQVGQAIGLLTDYLPEQPALVGHMYALEGYTEVFLAEFFCSGIPLSTLDYKGEYTLQPGSTTEAVLTHAVAQFDSGLALAGDSVRFLALARVGKARALLGLGQYAAAAAAVSAVPDDYQYTIGYLASTAPDLRNFAGVDAGTIWDLSVADQEGSNGLNYRTSGDPRTRTTTQVSITGFTSWHPDKYDVTGVTPIVLASGLEARLIEAEAALQANPDNGVWLTTLNALRTDGTFDITATTPPDTLWHAGSGGMAGLRPLADPGTPDGRVDLVFRERAFWLFLTGHRQGDMRRLIRQYDRADDQVYPVGETGVANYPVYGSDVTAPIPVDERVSNPKFTGCASRGA